MRIFSKCDRNVNFGRTIADYGSKSEYKYMYHASSGLTARTTHGYLYIAIIK